MEKEKIKKLEQRIDDLEKEMKLLKGEPEPKTTVPKVAIETIEPKKTDVKKEKRDWETLIGKVWLPRIFIFVLLLGVVWGFHMAVGAGWINESGIIIIGFLVAGLLYYLGDKQLKEKRVALGKVLLVGSISTLMVTTFAMNVLFDMVPSVIAFILNIVWIGIGLYLANRHHSESMGTMFAVAGFLIPFLLEGNGSTTVIAMVIIYELIFYIALLVFSVKNQYRTMFYVSTGFLHFVYFLLIGSSGVVEVELLLSLGILIQHEVIFYILVNNKLDKLRALPLMFTSFLVTLLWAGFGFELFDPWNQYHLFTIYLLATTIRYGLVAYQSKIKQNAELLSLSTVIATMGVSVLIMDLVNNDYLMVSFYLIQGILAIYTGYVFRSKMQKVVGYFIYYVATLNVLSTGLYQIENLIGWLILIGPLCYLIQFNYNRKDEAFLHINIVVALIVLLNFLSNVMAETVYAGTTALLLQKLVWIAVIGSLFYLYQITNKGLNKTFRWIYIGINVIIHLHFIAILPDGFIPNYSNENVLLTTLGWALYALSCVYMGMRREQKPLRMLGMGLILFTLLKLIFVDLVFISLATRSILFVLIGVIGIILSRFIYGKNK